MGYADETRENRGWVTGRELFDEVLDMIDTSSILMDEEGAHCHKCAARSLHDESNSSSFYKSSWFEGFLTPMPASADYTLNGKVDISRRPYRIDINSNVPPPRQEIAFTHEMLHTLNDTMKWGLSHEKLHDIAFTLSGEVIPGMQALRELNGTQ